MIAPVVALEAELSPGTWKDLFPDLIRDPLRWRRGIFGAGPLDRLAGPGTAAFTLDNTELNSAGIAGLYSPRGPNLLAGFRRGTRIRIHLDDGTNPRYVWAGRITKITPEPNLAGLRVSTVEAVDWFGEFAEFTASDLALREAVTGDVLMGDLVDILPRQPANRDFDVGIDEYEYAFDDLGGSPKAPEVAHDILMSGLDYLYPRGDATDGETLRYENRHAQAIASIAASFTGDELENVADVLSVPTGDELVVNVAEVQTVPRRVDPPASTTVLFKSEAAILVRAGETKDVYFWYLDPANEAVHVGIKDPIPLAVTTDWTANSQQAGGGSDLAAAFSVVAAFGASRAAVTLTNTGGTDGYVRGPGSADGLQGRGRALRRYRPVTSRATNQASIDDHGERPLPSPLLMPYQSDSNVGQGAAQWIANVYADPAAPTLMKFPSELGDDYLAHGILRDCGDKIAISEDQIGLDAEVGIIRGLEQELGLDGRLYTRWAMAPTDAAQVLIWDDPVAGVWDANNWGY